MTNTLSERTLEEIFSDTLFVTPAVSIRGDDSLSDAALLLPHYLETLTDSLVVTDNDKPVGIIGGIEILEAVLKTPTFNFLNNTKISSVMSRKLVIVNSNDRFSHLIESWSQTRRAFAIIPNLHHGYSVISARKILGIGISLKINSMLSSITRKPIIRFHKDELVKQIIQRMFDNKTRKLVLSDSSNFINDRIIIQKLSRDLDCLRNGEDFLNMKLDSFSLDKAEVVQDTLSISEACKIMQNMRSPYLLTNNNVISPWDIASFLSSVKLEI